MQKITLTASAAYRLKMALDDIERDTDSAAHPVKTISIQAGDPSGEPNGWDECDISIEMETVTLSLDPIE